MPQGQLIRETNPAQGFQAALVPQHELANGDYKATGENAPLPVSIEDGGAAAQVDVQYRKQKTFVTHTASVIVANGTTNGPWIDTDGFDKIVATLSNDAAINSQVHFHFSNDGVNIHSLEMTANNALQNYSVVTETKLRWVRVVFKNMDGAAPHTMNGLAYLKV